MENYKNKKNMMQKIRYERPFIKKLETGMPNKFGMKTEYIPLTHIDNVGIADTIKKYGSPVFIISERTVRNNYQEAYRAFTTRYPKVQFAWSYKTNYLNALCHVLHQEGSWAEVVSGFEYDKARNNGVPGSKILFNGPDKSDEDLKKAIENSSPIHIDHLDELYSVIQMAKSIKKKARVAIRVNMDTGVYPMWDRFGFNYENGSAWDALNKIMQSDSLELIGLHCHIGTFMLSAQAYGIAASKMADLLVHVHKKFDHQIKYIDMGGGFASTNTLKGSYLQGMDISPSFDDYAEAISSALLNSDLDPDNMPLLILETGRALVDNAGYIAGTVLSNKRLSDGRRATIVDFGVNILFTSYWYNHRVSPVQDFSHYTEDTVIFGPLCMNIDVIRESVSLPILKKGDHLVVHHVGAYNMTQWMQFITLRPRILLIDTKSEVHVIREKESPDYISQLENVPGYLKEFKL
jgi:diaminopimelate decarboxylase